MFGICTEALYCGKAPSARCIWRPGALPNECELFYGFSRFAIELNEILETERHFLPLTDTRFRPDQRALEVKKSISEQKWIDHPTLNKCVCRLKHLMYSFILINSQRTMYACIVGLAYVVFEVRKVDEDLDLGKL